MAGTIFRPEGVEIWMTAKNQLLDNQSPHDLILKGESERVMGLLLALGEGVIF